MQRLKDKTIVVIGGGGIGDGLAARYAREGARVVLGDLDGDAARAAAKRIADEGGSIEGRQLDASDGNAIGEFFRTMADAGGIDGVHLNFADFRAAHPRMDLLSLPVEAFDAQHIVNERGTFLCARHAVPLLVERGGGSIVFTGSGAAATAGPSGFAYGMAKAATSVLMRHIAHRWGADLVRANVIQCGMVLHERLRAVAGPDIERRSLASQAYKGRVSGPEEIAALGALLMSDEGATITGQVIAIDGGSTMRS